MAKIPDSPTEHDGSLGRDVRNDDLPQRECRAKSDQRRLDASRRIGVVFGLRMTSAKPLTFIPSSAPACSTDRVNACYMTFSCVKTPGAKTVSLEKAGDRPARRHAGAAQAIRVLVRRRIGEAEGVDGDIGAKDCRRPAERSLPLATRARGEAFAILGLVVVGGALDEGVVVQRVRHHVAKARSWSSAI